MTEEHHHSHHHHGHHRRPHSSTSDAALSRDVRRQQYRLVATAIPAVFLVLGFAVWFWAAKQDETEGVQARTLLKQCGRMFMVFGGGILLIFLVAEWIRRIRTALQNHKKRKSEHHHHRHHHHHHHHHDGSSAPETPGNSAD